MEWNIHIPCLETHRSKNHSSVDPRLVTAIHSGKLGDIIYALPTVRALEINHLVLNAFQMEGDPLRKISYSALKGLIPLLLEQSYIDRVSLTQFNFQLEKLPVPIRGIQYNLDNFRNVPRHKIKTPNIQWDKQVKRFSIDEYPVHLGHCFGASQNINPSLQTPWISAPASKTTQGSVIVSITNNWRTFPNEYWRFLLKGIGEIFFVGTESEFHQAAIPGAKYLPCKDYLELASYIAGAKFFLGTVSFPYSLAEALKVPRMVELCHKNLNAFPMGENGNVLPIDVLEARNLLKFHLPKTQVPFYALLTREQRKDPFLHCHRFFNWGNTVFRLRLKNIFKTFRMCISRTYHFLFDGRAYANS